MQADRIQRNDVPVQPGRKHSRQSFQLADNRSSAIAQAKLIQNVIQRAALIDSSSCGTIAPRKLTPGFDSWQENVLYINPDPGFGRNYGCMPGLSIEHISKYGEGHSEPNLISKFYKNPAGGDWEKANVLVDDANKKPPRVKFELFTERHPCPNCERNLLDKRFTSGDKIYWTYPYGILPAQIAANYLGDVDMTALSGQYPEKNFGTPIVKEDVFGTIKLAVPYT